MLETLQVVPVVTHLEPSCFMFSNNFLAEYPCQNKFLGLALEVQQLQIALVADSLVFGAIF